MLLYLVAGLILATSCLAGHGEDRAHDLRGDWGGHLSLLHARLAGPHVSGESNWVLDFWNGPPLAALAKGHGLTNNHALIIDAHGESRRTPAGRDFVLVPHRDLVGPAPVADAFSFRDLARMLGPERLKIHNLILSACNRDGSFDARSVRRCFPAVTNIVHLPAGELGFKPTFYQALFRRSSQIGSIFGRKVERGAPGEFYELDESSTPESRPLRPYVAELFLPRANKPYRITRAGREILEPGS